MTAFIGVRISWLMLAKNSDLALSADSASSLAFISSSSARFRAKAPPIEAAVAWRIDTSTPVQMGSEWQSSKPINPQNFDPIIIGIARIDLMFWDCNTVLSDSGNSRTNPFIGWPAESISCHRDISTWHRHLYKLGSSICDVVESRAHLNLRLSRCLPISDSLISMMYTRSTRVAAPRSSKVSFIAKFRFVSVRRMFVATATPPSRMSLFWSAFSALIRSVTSMLTPTRPITSELILFTVLNV